MVGIALLAATAGLAQSTPTPGIPITMPTSFPMKPPPPTPTGTPTAVPTTTLVPPPGTFR
jgi:hypothetical protein